MSDFLDVIVGEKRAAARSRACSVAPARTAGPPRDFRAAIAAPGLSIVAEIKRRSPSAGALRPDLDPSATACSLALAGARALSVLTEPRWFGGSTHDLVAARAACGVPVLRKDFLLEPREILVSHRLGADAVLLIARILDPALLAEMIAAAEEIGIASVVEAHDESDLERAIDSRATVIGINSRDLRTLEVDRARARALRALVPLDRLVLAESGVRSADDARAVAACGFDGLLVGTALMRARDPAAALQGLRAEPAP